MFIFAHTNPKNSGQPYLYGGKERMRDGSLNDYDFSARRLNSALALWTAPDPMARDFSNINPYVYCAGNPIKYVDPTGCVIVGQTQLVENYIEFLKNMKKGAQKEGIEELVSFCNNQMNQIKKLKKSKNVYEVRTTKNNFGFLGIDEESGNITVNIPGECLNQNSHVGHELQHAFQFEKGELSILPESAGKLPYLYDLNDEIEAYEVTNIVQSGKMYFLSPNSKSTEETLNRKGIPQKYNYKWSVDDIKEIGNYYHLPEENLKIREERKQEIIEILKERNEYYNKNL